MMDNENFTPKGEIIIYQTENGNTITRVTPLGEEEMIGEISRLSGSRGISAESDANARNMKNWCNDFKKGL